MTDVDSGHESSRSAESDTDLTPAKRKDRMAKSLSSNTTRQSTEAELQCNDTVQPKRRRRRTANNDTPIKRRRPLPGPEQLDLRKWNPSMFDKVVMGIKTETRNCNCLHCRIVSRENTPLKYNCPAVKCGVKANDCVSFFEHQLQAHGRIFSQCKRIAMELNHQDRGILPLPPATVFIGEQYFNPWSRPTKWTLERIREEGVTLYDRLFEKELVRSQQVWFFFKKAYRQIQTGGLALLDSQYRMAVEYYNSCLVFGADTRTFHDGTDCVGVGRNWLLSSDPEHADLMKPFDIDISDDEEYWDSNDILLMESGVRPPPAPAPVPTARPAVGAPPQQAPKKRGRKKKIATAPAKTNDTPVGDDSDVEIVEPEAPPQKTNADDESKEAEATAYAF